GRDASDRGHHVAETDIGGAEMVAVQPQLDDRAGHLQGKGQQRARGTDSSDPDQVAASPFELLQVSG
ncbi:MAG: hypothetical protein GY695_12345, partial [Aestuariibacter sp.]|nr:hypothetical protein [Aestuariibacter sp.]